MNMLDTLRSRPERETCSSCGDTVNPDSHDEDQCAINTLPDDVLAGLAEDAAFERGRDERRGI